MSVERTNYFARAGKSAEVLGIRRKACDARVRLGLPRGTIFTKHDKAGDGADVGWECSYTTTAEWERDMAVREASAAFGAVRAEMGNLIDRFERHLSKVDEPGGGSVPVSGASNAGQATVPQDVKFRSGEHDLAGYLYLPPGPGPFACIITNHGSAIDQGTSDLCRPGTASLLLSWGYASFLPHRAGYGASPGTPWRGDVCAEFGTPEYDTQLAMRMDTESDDVLAALDWLKARPEIDTGHIAVMGSSFGGTVTLLAAAKTRGFRCAVDFAGAAMNWERTANLRQLMKAATSRLSCPVFFLQAANDYSTAPTTELGKLIAGGSPGSKARVFPAFGLSNDEGHFFEKNGSLLWGPEVREFLDRWI